MWLWEVEVCSRPWAQQKRENENPYGLQAERSLGIAVRRSARRVTAARRGPYLLSWISTSIYLLHQPLRNWRWNCLVFWKSFFGREKQNFIYRAVLTYSTCCLNTSWLCSYFTQMFQAPSPQPQTHVFVLYMFVCLHCIWCVCILYVCDAYFISFVVFALFLFKSRIRFYGELSWEYHDIIIRSRKFGIPQLCQEEAVQTVKGFDANCDVVFLRIVSAYVHDCYERNKCRGT